MYITICLTEMDDTEASLGRFAFAFSRYVTAGIRSRWLNWTVRLWKMGAARSKSWLLGHGIRWPSCNYKSSSGNKDQEQKEDGLCPKRERSLAPTTHHGFD